MATTDTNPSGDNTQKADTPRTSRAAASAGAASRTGGRARGRELEEQIEQLQDDLKSIASTLAALAGDKVTEARSAAEKRTLSLARTGQHAVDEVQDELGQLERRLRTTIREKPLTAVASALAVGFILAVVSR